MATMDEQRSRLNWILATLGALVVLVLLNVWMALPAAAQRTAVIATCGTLTQAMPALGSAGIIGLDQSGNVCVSASVTASVTGFAPAGTFATLTATGSSASVALPAGTVVVFSNTGTTAVSCTLGIGSATAVVSNNVIQSGSWMALTVGSNTFGACIDQAGSASNVVVLSGGSGLPTGAGGGGSGGGGGAVTVADGADVAQGTTTAAACATDNGTCTVVQLVKRFNQRLTTLITNLGSGNSNGQATMVDSAPVVIASNQSANALWGHAATGGAVPANAQYWGVNVGGNLTGFAPGTAGTASTQVVTVQGVSSMTKLLVTPDSVALPANQSVNVSQVNGVTTLTGTGATGTGAQRVTVSTDQATNAGAALVKGGVGVVNGGSFYQAVAASQTATVLQASTGATGDYLSHCVLYPTSTSPGVVTVFDNTNAAGTSAILFPGGSTSLSNLAPISIPVGAVSTAGAWKVTTGSAISVVCYGKFS